MEHWDVSTQSTRCSSSMTELITIVYCLGKYNSGADSIACEMMNFLLHLPTSDFNGIQNIRVPVLSSAVTHMLCGFLHDSRSLLSMILSESSAVPMPV